MLFTFFLTGPGSSVHPFLGEKGHLFAVKGQWFYLKMYLFAVKGQ